MGRSLVATTLQTAKGRRGSRFYASTEMVRDRGIWAVANLFSLRLILFALATGERFVASVLPEVLKARIGSTNCIPVLRTHYTPDFPLLV